MPRIQMNVENLKIAVRTFRRLRDRIISEHALAVEADRGFDGGEWSYGWHTAHLHDEIARVLCVVANRFHVSPLRIDTIAQEHDHHV